MAPNDLGELNHVNGELLLSERSLVQMKAGLLQVTASPGSSLFRTGCSTFSIITSIGGREVKPRQALWVIVLRTEEQLNLL